MQLSLGLCVIYSDRDGKLHPKDGQDPTGILSSGSSQSLVHGEADEILQCFRAPGTKAEIWVWLLPQRVTLGMLLSQSESLHVSDVGHKVPTLMGHWGIKGDA